MFKRCLILFALLGLMLPLPAQSWKKLRKQAEEELAAEEYEKAAQTFEAAWEKKSKKTELIHSAAEAYYRARDYRKAAECYRKVIDDTKNYPLADLYYARSLKSEGNYDAAERALKRLDANYSGAGKEQLERVIQHELLGCQLARSMAPMPGLRVVYPGNSINTEEDEFAPEPLQDLLLYTSSDGERTRLLAGVPQPNGSWNGGNPPQGLPSIPADHFGNTSLSPDGNTLYFTVCEPEKRYHILDSPCRIFMLQWQGNAWSQPIELPEEINQEGTNNTHPAVTQNGDVEILYFVSDRPGGSGELDIWYTTRNRAVSSASFTTPINLGPEVNSPGNEVTPFYDAGREVLYFSTNGRPNIGGFDIYLAEGAFRQWSAPTHAGKPINSPADDYFFSARGSRAYVASNRRLSGMRSGTIDDDIFGFILPGRPVTLGGQVLDQATQQALAEGTVTVYQVGEAGRVPLGTQELENGQYAFDVKADMSYEVVISSPNFETGSYSVSTTDVNMDNYGQPVYLKRLAEEPPKQQAPPVVDLPKVGSGAPLPVIDDSGVEYTAKSMHPNDNAEYVSSAPRYKGEYFKVQIIATRRNLEAAKNKASTLESLGRIDTEYIIRSKLTRILIGDFFSEPEARNALDRIRTLGYDGAFMVRYQDGVRYGPVRNN